MLTSHSDVSESVLSSLHKKKGRRKEREQLMNSTIWAPLAVFAVGLLSGYCLKAALGGSSVRLGHADMHTICYVQP